MNRSRAMWGLAASVLLVAACGGDGEDAASPTTDVEHPAETTATSSAYPVTIQHAHGETVIGERPQTIVTLNVQWTDAVLAMGEQPAAYVLDQASLETEPYPWHVDQVAASKRIDATGTVPFEAIAAMQPDLILATFLAEDESVYNTLAGIAPTIPMLGDLQVDTWQQQVAVLGQVLDEPAKAAAVISDVEAQIDALASELPGLQGKTYVAANYVEGDGIYVVADPDDGASRFFYQLGMEIDPDVVALDAEAVGRVKISFEQVGLLDADFVGMLTNGSDPSVLPGWSQLTAVKTGALVDFEFADVVGINTPTPLSLPYEIELLRPALTAVADR